MAPAPRAPGLEILKLMTVATWIATTSLQPIAGIRAYCYPVTFGLLGPFDYTLREFGFITNQFSCRRAINLILEVIKDELSVPVNDGNRLIRCRSQYRIVPKIY